MNNLQHDLFDVGMIQQEKYVCLNVCDALQRVITLQHLSTESRLKAHRVGSPICSNASPFYDKTHPSLQHHTASHFNAVFADNLCLLIDDDTQNLTPLIEESSCDSVRNATNI